MFEPGHCPKSEVWREKLVPLPDQGIIQHGDALSS